MSEHTTYVLRFFFDWGVDSALWAGNDASLSRWDVGPLHGSMDDPLRLSDATWQRMRTLCEWHDRSLDWEYPLHPGPFRQAECDRFNSAVDDLLAAVREELGPSFLVVDRQVRLAEDPNLDRNPADPSAGSESD